MAPSSQLLWDHTAACSSMLLDECGTWVSPHVSPCAKQQSRCAQVRQRSLSGSEGGSVGLLDAAGEIKWPLYVHPQRGLPGWGSHSPKGSSPGVEPYDPQSIGEIRKLLKRNGKPSWS